MRNFTIMRMTLLLAIMANSSLTFGLNPFKNKECTAKQKTATKISKNYGYNYSLYLTAQAQSRLRALHAYKNEAASSLKVLLALKSKRMCNKSVDKTIAGLKRVLYSKIPKLQSTGTSASNSYPTTVLEASASAVRSHYKSKKCSMIIKETNQVISEYKKLERLLVISGSIAIKKRIAATRIKAEKILSLSNSIDCKVNKNTLRKIASQPSGRGQQNAQGYHTVQDSVQDSVQESTQAVRRIKRSVSGSSSNRNNQAASVINKVQPNTRFKVIERVK
jgi:hypothetical protein